MKDQFDRELREALQNDPIVVPEEVLAATEALLADLPERPRARRPVWFKSAVLAASLLLLMVGVLPNLSPAYAQTMAEVPILGRLVQVFTLRNYAHLDDAHELDAQIPAIHDPDHPLPEEVINQDVESLTQAVIQQFYRELEASQGQGYGSVHIDYEVVTNTPRWFTLKLTVHETAAGSHTYARFYHIDREAGAYVTFGDLFDEADYPVLQRLILEEMARRMAADGDAVYWDGTEEPRQEVVYLHPGQNFYFLDDGDLVIVYDAYEVAPGFMGCPEFIISEGDYSPLWDNADTPDNPS